MPYDHDRPLFATDLYGRWMISYMRFSSSQQGSGSTLERQRETLDRVQAHYKLVEDDALLDRARSASKGHHRTKGELGGLLEAIKRKEVDFVGRVFVVEAIDRLLRERFFAAYDLIKALIQGGLIIVTGDMTIWNEATINSDLNHKLIAEINAARKYTERLAEMSSGAHRAVRRKLEAVASDSDIALPYLNARPPGWIVRSGALAPGTYTQKDYALHPKHAQTVQLIFQMCIDGTGAQAIAAKLNQMGTPPVGQTKATVWRTSRVAEILRDEHVLGFVQPMVRLDGGRRRKPVGNRVKLYPAVIEAATWVKAREILAARRGTLTGRRGKTVANLFTGKVFCDTCGAPMRSDTSGHIDKQGRQDRSLVCTRYRESKVCTDKTRFNMLHYEFPILAELVDSRRTLLAPRAVNHSEKEIAEQLAGLRVEIAGLEAAMTALEPELGGPKIILTRYTAMAAEHEAKTKKADALETIVAAAASTNSPRDGIHKFMRELIGPAVRGDVDARERLRALLSRFDFKISGRLPGMAITFADGSEVTIDPPSMA